MRRRRAITAAPVPPTALWLQRACDCGQHIRGGGTCAACREGSPWLGKNPRASVGRALASPGHPIDPPVRRQMESRFGQDFSRVRLHSGSDAAASAAALSARAYAVGQHVVFGDGGYAPATTDGRRLLAHELAHTVQQGNAGEHVGAARAEQEARAAADEPSGRPRLSRRPVGIHLAPVRGAPGPAPAGMTRQAFERTMRTRWGVTSVVTGTQAQQTAAATPPGGAPRGGIVLPNWQSWDPGATSEIYDQILAGFDDFAAAIGGAPTVTEIVFYNVDYDVNAAGVATQDAETGATFGAGRLKLFRALTTGGKWLPVARSKAKGRYPSVLLPVTGIPGQSPGAPIPYPKSEQSRRRTISHELGHGLAEAAMAQNPDTFRDFRQAVGWTATAPEELYDVRAAGVSAALASTPPKTPPAAARITVNDWNSPVHREQPMTDYAVRGGPSEDFAESVMALVHAPAVLKSRSPARYRFLTQRLSGWLSKLLQPQPVP